MKLNNTPKTGHSRIITGGWVSEAVVNNLRKKPGGPVKYTKLVGWWDHEFGPDNGRGFLPYVNVGKSMSSVGSGIVEQGIPAVLMIAGFNSGDDVRVWRKRLQDKAKQVPPPEHTSFIILVDEPYGAGWDDEKLETLVYEARKAMPGHKFAYTVKQLTILNRPGRKLPQNIDYLGINYYPFRANARQGAENKREFNRLANRIMSKAKEKIGCRFFIVGQAFHSGKWIEPPAESPLWYAEFVQKNRDTDALLFWQWRSRGWTGANELPVFYENFKKILAANG